MKNNKFYLLYSDLTTLPGHHILFALNLARLAMAKRTLDPVILDQALGLMWINLNISTSEKKHNKFLFKNVNISNTVFTNLSGHSIL